SHHPGNQLAAALRADGERKFRRAPNDFCRRTHGQTVRRNRARHERVRPDHGAVANGTAGHDEHAPWQPDAPAQRHRLVSDGIAVQHVQPRAVSKDETVAANAGVIADRDGLGGVDERHLQHDRATAECESRLGKLRAAHVDLFADARILADFDRLTRHVAERAHTGMPADPDRLSLHYREQPDLHMVAQLDVVAHDHGARREGDAAPDPVAEKRAICPALERTRHPAEYQEVPPWYARLRNQRLAHASLIGEVSGGSGNVTAPSRIASSADAPREGTSVMEPE